MNTISRRENKISIRSPPETVEGWLFYVSILFYSCLHLQLPHLPFLQKDGYRKGLRKMRYGLRKVEKATVQERHESTGTSLVVLSFPRNEPEHCGCSNI
jgi:hypothetical protein